MSEMFVRGFVRASVLVVLGFVLEYIWKEGRSEL